MTRDPKAIATAYGGKGILLPRKPANDFRADESRV